MGKKRLIPFSCMPASWGAKGFSKERMRAEYELDGIELDFALADIAHRESNGTPDSLIAKHLEINLKHKIITEREHDFKIAELRDDPLTMLKVQLKYGDISQKQYDKGAATLAGEPWVDIPNIVFDEKNPGGGSLELDWNDTFIEMLEEAGYVAPAPEDIVDLWLTDLCRNIALEELHGVGDFEENAEQAMGIKRKRLDDGTVEVS